jgi:hypothetical protein
MVWTSSSRHKDGIQVEALSSNHVGAMRAGMWHAARARRLLQLHLSARLQVVSSTSSTSRHESSSHRQLLRHPGTTTTCRGDLLHHHACADDLFDIFTSRCSFGSSNLQRLIADLFSVSSLPHQLRSRLHAKAKCLFQLNILTTIISVSATFANLLYILFLAPFPLPLRHTRGLGVADLDTLGGLALPI